jgi:hypothetical protein
MARVSERQPTGHPSIERPGGVQSSAKSVDSNQGAADTFATVLEATIVGSVATADVLMAAVTFEAVGALGALEIIGLVSASLAGAGVVAFGGFAIVALVAPSDKLSISAVWGHVSTLTSIGGLGGTAVAGAATGSAAAANSWGKTGAAAEGVLTLMEGALKGSKRTVLDVGKMATSGKGLVDYLWELSTDQDMALPGLAEVEESTSSESGHESGVDTDIGDFDDGTGDFDGDGGVDMDGPS